MELQEARNRLENLIRTVTVFEQELEKIRVTAVVLSRQVGEMIRRQDQQEVNLERVFSKQRSMRYAELLEQIMVVMGCGYNVGREHIKNLMSSGEIVRTGKVNTKTARYERGSAD